LRLAVASFIPMDKGERTRGDALVASNRKARHDYTIVDVVEAGIVLLGSEVKSARAGQVQLADAYAHVIRGEMFLEGMHIAPYQFAVGVGSHEPVRRRKLLLHAEEISALIGKVERAGYTLVPLDLHLTRGRVKLTIGLAKGKKQHDKRASEKDREWERQKQRLMRV